GQAEGCGEELNWVDLSDQRHVGNVFIHFRNGTVFQVDVADRSFHTLDGISLLSSPAQIRQRDPRLEAWVLSDVTSDALGGRPLIYWIDRKQGIAFSFAYSNSDRKRSLYEIIVFRPGTQICPQDASTDAAAKKRLAPFSLEP
ncbi:MAG TPA: hypothetical protein VMD29_02330, partial [Terracidiphilus sp.]|nr:hypothetical protein [Terracidiphilus sp.]